jgi:hypothetical protein
VVNAFAGIGTAVTLFPVVKRQNGPGRRAVAGALVLLGLVGRVSGPASLLTPPIAVWEFADQLARPTRWKMRLSWR